MFDYGLMMPGKKLFCHMNIQTSLCKRFSALILKLKPFSADHFNFNAIYAQDVCSNNFLTSFIAKQVRAEKKG